MKKNENGFKSKWTIGLLNKLIGLAYKRNQHVSIFNLRNLQKLLDLSDFSEYMTKSVIIKRVEFLKRSLEARLDHKMVDEDLIVHYAAQDNDDDVIDVIVTNLQKYKDLKHHEVEYLNKMVEDRLTFGNLQNHLVEIERIIEKVDTNEFQTYGQAYQWIDDWINNFRKDIRKIRSETSNGVIRMNDPNIKEKIDDILQKLGTTQNILITGVQMLNDLLAPGYRGSRLYTYAALPANFKSGILLKAAVDVVRFNAKSYRGRKDTHKKAVVYFTQENTKEESFQRMFEMTVNNSDITEYKSEKIMADLKRANIIDNDDMELIIVYKPNRSISTADVRAFIEELDEEGVEVVLLAHDYLKRIRSQEKAATEKEELKFVTDEMRQIAVDWDIPIICAAQLNRVAASTIANAVRGGKSDALKEIDSSMVGSAWEIIENSDVVILLTMQKRKKDGKLFLSFSLVKNRYKEVEIKYFNQPFDENRFDLYNDILDNKPAGLVSLATDFEEVDLDMYEKRGRKRHVTSDNEEVIIQNDVFNLSPLS